jgi:hypothetical protein
MINVIMRNAFAVSILLYALYKNIKIFFWIFLLGKLPLMLGCELFERFIDYFFKAEFCVVHINNSRVKFHA